MEGGGVMRRDTDWRNRSHTHSHQDVLGQQRLLQSLTLTSPPTIIVLSSIALFYQLEMMLMVGSQLGVTLIIGTE